MNKTLPILATLVVVVILLGSLASATGTCCKTPVIVAKGTLVNPQQVTPVTIFTPHYSGLYRISLYGTMTPPLPASSFGVFLAWTDDNGSQGPVEILSGGGSEGYGFNPYLNGVEPGNVITFQAVAGSPVNFSVSYGGTTTFSLNYVLEQLASTP